MIDTPAPLRWEDAYNNMDVVLASIEGLVHAAFVIADEHPHLDTAEPASVAPDAVLRLLREKNEQLREARSAEYRAGLAPDRAAETS